MKQWRFLVIGFVMICLLAGAIWLEPGNDPTSAQGNNTWQVETDVWKDDLAGVLETIDASCDVDIEPQGVSAYVVAYRCPGS